MNEIFCVLPLAIIVGSTLILKILDVICKRSIEKQESVYIQEQLNLMDEKVSYVQFEKVSKESLRVNSPVRKQYDFLDFVLEHIDSNPKNIENKILMLDYGE